MGMVLDSSVTGGAVVVALVVVIVWLAVLTWRVRRLSWRLGAHLCPPKRLIDNVSIPVSDILARFRERTAEADGIPGEHSRPLRPTRASPTRVEQTVPLDLADEVSTPRG